MSEATNPLAGLEAAAQRQIEKNKGREHVDEVPQEGKEVVQQVQEDAPVEETPKEQVPQEEDKPTQEPSDNEVIQESEPPQEEDTKPEEEASKEDIQEDGTISDWDVVENEVEAGETKPAEVDFKSIASELGFEAATKEELIEKVSEVKAKAEAPDALADLPDNLKEAITIAKQDGDYLEYLGLTSVDYDAYDNAVIVQNHYANVLRDANGNVDTEKLEMMMDSMTEAEIDVKGIELKQSYKAARDQRSNAIKEKAARERQEADRQLKSTLDSLTDHRGFKLNSTHKKQLYDGISSGDMISQMFNGPDGKPDMNKVVRAYSDFLFADKQNKFLRQQASTQAKKEVLNRLSNKQIEPKTSLPTPKKEIKDTQGKLAQMAREGKNPFEPVYKR